MVKVKRKGTKIKKQNKLKTKLSRQGKLKHTRHKKPVIKAVNVEEPFPDDEDVQGSDHGEDMLEMVEKEDLDFLKQSIIHKNYSLYNDNDFIVNKKKKKKNREKISVEEVYEDELKSENDEKQTRMLLPIKTNSGFIRRAVTERVKEEEWDEKVKEEEQSEGEASVGSDEFEITVPDLDIVRPVSTAEMLAWREQTMARYKFRIGILCSGLLEDPELKIQNIKKLLNIYDDWHPELQITLKKLIVVSLLEVFKDLIPSYLIKHQDDANVKLKKDTRRIQMFEKSLLKGYREYLTRLEKLASKLYKKKGDTRIFSQCEILLGELSINCLCELLITHPYSNYSKNIVHLITPYLDNKRSSVRAAVSSTFKSLFALDKRGEITLEIVRRINDLVKKKKHSVHPDVILVLESLRLHDINLDDINEQKAKHKKALEKKKRLINLSRMEKKRLKRLAEVEQELLETKGEENKQSRQAMLTEVTKFVFTMYFRILKSAPSSGLLSAALQGLAKFASCINIEFYLDLVKVLDDLMKTGDLKVQEQMNCALTVFTILSGQGEVLNIDPNNFYRHLYNNMLQISAGGNSNVSHSLHDCLEKVIIGRRKKLTHQRLVGFIKRLATMTLHQDTHVILSSLAIIKQIFQVQKTTDILLDMDTGVGQGIYLPELDDPEHCNASSSSLYELLALQKHYHPVVKQFAHHIASGVPATGPGSLPADISKLGCMELFSKYDSREINFNPPVSNRLLTRSTKAKNIWQNCMAIQKKYLSDFSVSLDQEPFKMEEG